MGLVPGSRRVIATSATWRGALYAPLNGQRARGKRREQRPFNAHSTRPPSGKHSGPEPAGPETTNDHCPGNMLVRLPGDSINTHPISALAVESCSYNFSAIACQCRSSYSRDLCAREKWVGFIQCTAEYVHPSRLGNAITESFSFTILCSWSGAAYINDGVLVVPPGMRKPRAAR